MTEVINVLKTAPGMIIAAISSLIALVVGIVIGMFIGGGSAGAAEETDDRKQKGPRIPGDIEIYVGNLSYDVSDRDLEKVFAQFGKIDSVRIIKNRFSGKSKGFGFVEMSDRGEANKAINALNGKDIKGRKLVVNEAKSKSRDD